MGNEDLGVGSWVLGDWDVGVSSESKVGLGDRSESKEMEIWEL